MNFQNWTSKYGLENNYINYTTTKINSCFIKKKIFRLIHDSLLWLILKLCAIYAFLLFLLYSLKIDKSLSPLQHI